MSNIILAQISLGELIDKITILEIKMQKLKGKALININKELNSLKETLADSNILVEPSLISELRLVNQELWRIEDEIRIHEKQNNFGNSFIQLARSVYKHNDQRAAIKRRINIEHIQTSSKKNLIKTISKFDDFNLHN